MRTDGQPQRHANVPPGVVAAPEPLEHEDERRHVQRKSDKLVHDHQRHGHAHPVAERQHSGAASMRRVGAAPPLICTGGLSGGLVLMVIQGIMYLLDR